ncbi:glycoside hydrolase family 53 protein [Algibacillus agarilyticus]|uniref:glycoside hydrolase family 53 protein n=1 Tax=Algibacillus agarilyticus TaxID=2234133 RepID=UPI000DCFAC31|nr:glycosyl hydrolase 53 family protein [Algibacillus agarilyticus]
MIKIVISILLAIGLLACSNGQSTAPVIDTPVINPPVVVDNIEEPSSDLAIYYKGADLSYVNEMEDCGATYFESGIQKDPYQLFADHGANLVRVRLWHDPLARHAMPSDYSGFNDAVKSIQRAKNAGMHVLLDFHYSDNWADPADQAIPAAWAHLLNNTDLLANALYQYTHQTLIDLDELGLLPEMIQIGNETNGNIMQAENANLYPVDFSRQVQLLNAGLRAVADMAQTAAFTPMTVLHVADPNNGDWWFNEIENAGINDYDIMGFSYYPEWHPGSVTQIVNMLDTLKQRFNREVMIVETGVPWGNDNADTAANMMNILPAGYGKPSVAGQREFLIDLATQVHAIDGLGTLYWEPAWVSTGCQTQWGTGSHWDNATFFDFNNELQTLGGIGFLEKEYTAN